MISLLATPIISLLLFLPTYLTPNQQPTATTTPPAVEVPVTFDTEMTRLSSKYGVNEKLAREIIKCESLIYGQDAENKNYDKYGNHWSTDWGYFQINDYWHEKPAKKLGYDIYDWKGNLEYGFLLISRDGLRHWSASKWCWEDWKN